MTLRMHVEWPGPLIERVTVCELFIEKLLAARLTGANRPPCCDKIAECGFGTKPCVLLITQGDFQQAVFIYPCPRSSS